MKLTMFFDGARKTTTGKAGCGACVYDSTGRELASASVFLGNSMPHNEAEYAGLMVGLQLASLLAVSMLEVRGDSRLIVQQMTGECRVRNARLRELNPIAHSLVRWPTSFMWIPRKLNGRADQLANEGCQLG